MKEASVLPIFIAVTVLFAVFVFFIIFFIFTAQRKRAILLAEKQKAVFEEQERTMTQVSKELHDNIGNWLNLLLMNARMIKDGRQTTEQTELVKNIIDIGEQVIGDVRDISHSMNSDFIRQRGLYNLLAEQFHYINSAKKIQCNIEIQGDANILSPEEQLIIFRIAQEAIRNTIKHAEANKLNISLSCEAENFIMTIEDDGIGYNADTAKSIKGLGVLSMHDRAKMINGLISVDAETGHGCKITLSVKVPKAIIT